MQYGVQMKGVIDVLRCSRCKVLFKGSGGIALLWCNVLLRRGSRVNVLWLWCNIVFKGSGGVDLLPKVHPTVQGRCGVDVFWCSRRNIAFKGAWRVNRCNALFRGGGRVDLLWYWRCNVVFKGVAGLIVLGCSRCDAVITGGGGVDLLWCCRCNIMLRKGGGADAL